MKSQKWLKALNRTRRSTFGKISSLLGVSEIDLEFWETLEAELIQADLGLPLVESLLSDLKKSVQIDGYTKREPLLESFRSQLRGLLHAPESPTLTEKPWVIVLVGVNGSGKTTSAARLAHWWKTQGKSVLLAQADTFRAAASEQLGTWADRLKVGMIKGEEGSDPGAVVYSAIQAAQHRRDDLVITDTSGRMHTQHNLMQEIEKIIRVSRKAIPGSPHEVLLVLDATTGQNGLMQAQAFLDAVPLTGIILAKLDSSARGGAGLAVHHLLELPIQFVGLGETIDDFAPFDPDEFVDGLLPLPE